MSLERVDGQVIERDAARLSTFRGFKKAMASAVLPDRLTYERRFIVEINCIPCKTTDFTTSHTGHGGDGEKRVVFRRLRRLKKMRDFIGAECTRGGRCALRRIAPLEVRDISRQKLKINSPLEHPMNDAMHAQNRGLSERCAVAHLFTSVRSALAILDSLRAQIRIQVNEMRTPKLVRSNTADGRHHVQKEVLRVTACRLTCEIVRYRL